MFQGTIPPEARSMIRSLVGGWQAEDIHIGYSGSFTAERSLAGLGPRMHGHDVTIYSCSLGRYLAGQPVGIRLKDDAVDALGWLAGSLDDSSGTIATMLLATRFFGSLDKVDHPYHRRLVEGHMAQWSRLHDETRAKVEAAAGGLHLASFAAVDVREWLDQLPADAAVCSFLPFGADGNTPTWSALERYFDWPAPLAEPVEKDEIDDLVDAITDRPRWAIGSRRRWPEMESQLRGRIQLYPRAAPLFVYADGGGTRIAGPHQEMQLVTVPRLGPGDELGDHITLHPLTRGQFNFLRSQYLNPHISPGLAVIMLGVAVDGLLVGVFGLERSSYDRACAYMTTDFPVAPTDYPNLAKLVTTAAMSREAQLLLQRTTSIRARYISTTAFSNHHESMKYRGLLKLIKRAEVAAEHHRFELQYEAPIGEWTLAEGLEQWRRRWGRRDDAAAASR